MRFCFEWIILIFVGVIGVNCARQPLSTYDSGETHGLLNGSSFDTEETTAGSDTKALSAAQFAARREKLYKLPIPYAEVRDNLEAISSTFIATYLSPTLQSTPRAGTTTCDGGSLADWNSPASWPFLGYSASLFLSGSIIVRSDAAKPNLSSQLKNIFIAIADHVLTKANATYFRDFSTTSYNSVLGWNNLSSPWDAWGNGTCSLASEPNLWASGWALKILADAYAVTKDSKYLDGFNRGSLFWNSGMSSSIYSSLRDRAVMDSKLKAYTPYSVTSTYTVGGSRFSPAAAVDDPTQLVMRFHYYAADPGRYAVNDSGIMSLAMITAGIGSPNSSYLIADGKGHAITRTFSNIGFFGIYGVQGNLANYNFSYYDMDDIGYTNSTFETHADFSIYYLARAGAILSNQYFTQTARAAELETFRRVTQSERESYGVYVCLVRELDPKILNICKNYYSSFRAAYGASNIYGLYAATALLGEGITVK